MMLKESREELEKVLKDRNKKQIIFVLNKQDQDEALQEKEFTEIFRPDQFQIDYLILKTSTKTGFGMKDLLNTIFMKDQCFKIRGGWSFDVHLYYPHLYKLKVFYFMLILKRNKIKIPKFILSGIIKDFIGFEIKY